MTEKKVKMYDYLSPDERKKYSELRLRAQKSGKVIAKIQDGSAVIVDSAKLKTQIVDDKQILNAMKRNALNRRRKEQQLLKKVKNAGADKVGKLRQYLDNK